jgi:hypothetical protein
MIKTHPTPCPGPISESNRLFEEFEKLPAAERVRQVAEAEEVLRKNGVDNLERFDEWIRR